MLLISENIIYQGKHKIYLELIWLTLDLRDLPRILDLTRLSTEYTSIKSTIFKVVLVQFVVV